jgi:DNA-nicking Smr family endonuclease
MNKFNNWDDLKKIKKIVTEQHIQNEAAKAQAALKEKQRQAESRLFEAALGPVKKLTPPNRASLSHHKPAPLAKQFIEDEQSALQETLSDEFDPGTLLETDENLSFARPGIGPEVTTKLRNGKWSIQAQLDLHGMRREEARENLGAFIRESHQHGLRCVRVIHGKGLGSAGRTPILKGKVLSWLIQKQEVIAFAQAKPIHGGAGALIILLDTHKKESSLHGKPI